MQDYRQLRVHANAHNLAVAVRAATRRFPRNGYASLRAQMTSAAESISFNIVEGCGADSQKEFARFLEIGIKSAMELENPQERTTQKQSTQDAKSDSAEHPRL